MLFNSSFHFTPAAADCQEIVELGGLVEHDGLGK